VTPPLSSAHELRVRYAETDQMGVVYHANYLAWCEVGRTEFIRERGLPYAELERQGCGLAIMDAALRFHAPARYDDRIRVVTTLAELRSRTVRFEYVIEHAETGAKLVTASTTLIGRSLDGRVVSFPPVLRRALGEEVA
jgi:acyl-CoA thioester hydrolase